MFWVLCNYFIRTTSDFDEATGKHRVFSWLFHGMLVLDSNFPRLRWAWLCFRNYSRRPCPCRVRSIVRYSCVAYPKVLRETPCTLCILNFTFRPHSLDPFEIQRNAKTAIWTSAGANVASDVQFCSVSSGRCEVTNVSSNHTRAYSQHDCHCEL